MGSRDAELWVATGTWEAVSLLGDWLEERAKGVGARRPARLAVVVPSQVLVGRLTGLLCRRPALRLGLEVVTLRHLAERIAGHGPLVRLGGAGSDEAGGDETEGGGLERSEPLAEAGLELSCHRLLAEDGPLRERLGRFAEPHRLLAATLRDFFDAGLHSGLLQGGDLVAEEFGGLEATLLLDAAMRVEALARQAAFRFPWQVLSEAAERLRAGEEAGLPEWDAVAVYGFADATGLAADLLDALLSRYGGLVVQELPPDPLDPAARPRLPSLQADTPASWRHTARFTERMVGVCGGGVRLPEAAKEHAFDHVRLFEAPDPESEVREVAERILALLEEGTAPEEIAVVARDLGPHVRLVARVLTERAIPFSVREEVGFLAAWAHRFRALGRLLEEGADLGLELFLSLVESHGESGRSSRELALRILGVVDLAGLAALAEGEVPEKVSLPLTTFRAQDGEDEPEAEAEEASGSFVPAGELLELADRARRVLAALEDWPAQAGWQEHVARLEELCRVELGWRDRPEETEVWQRLGALLPQDVQVGREEFFDLVRPRLLDVGTVAPGGQGSGVQVLGVTQARAVPFEHIFLLGANAEFFPRRVAEDPLLRDEARRRLRAVLEALPVKAEGHDEEVFLFSQLLQAGRQVTLSWSRAGPEGKLRVRSPLVERLLVGAELDVGGAADWHRRAKGRGRCPSAWEVALAWALDRRPNLEEPLSLVLEEAFGELGLPEPAHWTFSDAALGRKQAQRELARTDGVRGLGPFLEPAGNLGEPPTHVSQWEAYARCAWEFFLGRVLGVEPPPEPEFELLDLEALQVGRVVHRALESLVGVSRVSLDQAEQRKGGPLAEPRDPVVLCRRAAEVLRDRGELPAELVEPVALRAAGFVDSAFKDPLREGALVLAAEVRGEARLSEEGPKVRFRADRVDRYQGGLLLTDYKTGTARSLGQVLEELRRGTMLQAAVYAACRERAVGRYLWLSASGGPPRSVFVWREEDTWKLAKLTDPSSTGDKEKSAKGCGDTAAETLALLRQAWEAGWVLPLVDVGKHSRCKSCGYRGACLVDNARARRRLESWAEASAPGHEVGRDFWKRVQK